MAPRTLSLIVLFTLSCPLVHTPVAATVSLALHGDEQRREDAANAGITAREETAAGGGHGAHDSDGAAASVDGVGPQRAAEETTAPAMSGAAVPRLKMARRFLAGEAGGADSAAKSSCHSNNVHNDCAPPSKH